MQMILIAPTEPKPILRLITDLGHEAIVSSQPEQRGADYLMVGQLGFVAVQRKEQGDLLSSVADGRLQREVSLLRYEPVPILIVEGWPAFTSDGQHLERPNWTKAGFRNLLRSVKDEGVQVEYTDDLADTAAALVEIQERWQKSAHTSLLTRPKRIRTDSFGRKRSEDKAAWALMGFSDGIGPVLARRIVEKFGGLPLLWTCSLEELCEVEGVGKKKAGDLLAGLV